MKYTILVCCVVLLAPAAYAEIYTTRSKCKPLTIHNAAGDVHVKPNVDQHGRAVPPADINAPPMDIEALKNPPIALNLPIDDYIKTDSYNADLSRAEIQVGTIRQAEQGQITLNNEILSTGTQDVYSEDCK